MLDPTPYPPCIFTTFGMFIIDEIEWPDNRHPRQVDLIGGAGTYAVLGARLAVSPAIPHHSTLPQAISWIVDTGNDFPASITAAINTWRTNCIFRHDPARLTTRAWNGYGPGDFRAFKYVTPKRRLEVSDLQTEQVHSQSFHMVCSADRCSALVSRLSEARGIDTTETPVIVWEPIPDLCSPEELAKVRQAARRCTVVSPNDDELRMFFDKHETDQLAQHELVSKLMGWDHGLQPASHQTGTDGSNNLSALYIEWPMCIIREGAKGSTAYIRLSSPSCSRILSLHLPAFYTSQTSSCVIDPTGGGNTYLGALAMALTGSFRDNILPLLASALDQTTESALQVNDDVSQLVDELLGSVSTPQIKQIFGALVFATVAASFAIEQFGVPQLDLKVQQEQQELWNGDSVARRIRSYLMHKGLAQDLFNTMNLRGADEGPSR